MLYEVITLHAGRLYLDRGHRLRLLGIVLLNKYVLDTLEFRLR